MVGGAVLGFFYWAIVVRAVAEEEAPESRQPEPGDKAMVCKGKFVGKTVVVVDVDESAETAQIRFEGQTKTVVRVLPLNAIEIVE